MTLNVLPAKEVKIFGDCAVVGVALLNVHVSCSQMSSYKAEICVVILQAYGYGTLVSRHSSKSRLLISQRWRVVLISSQTLRVAASTLRMTAVSSDLTRTINTDPTS